MAELQQAAANAILADPDVQSLSSVVGVDAANNTMLNTGSMLINLKRRPRQPGRRDARACASACARVAGVTLYLQPTQDLTIDAETGPTEFRVSLEGVDTATVNEWAQKLVERLRSVTAGAQRRPPMPARRACRPTSTSTATRPRACR